MQHAECGAVIQREAHDAKHREERGDALDGERLESDVAVDVHVGTVMVETDDHENHPEEKNDSTDDATQQEQLFDAVVRSKPLDHGLSPPPDVFVCVPAMETITRNSRSREFRKTITADGESTQEICLVICPLRGVVPGGAGGHHERQQMLLARMRRACRRSSLPGGQ